MQAAANTGAYDTVPAGTYRGFLPVAEPNKSRPTNNGVNWNIPVSTTVYVSEDVTLKGPVEHATVNCQHINQQHVAAMQVRSHMEGGRQQSRTDCPPEMISARPLYSLLCLLCLYAINALTGGCCLLTDGGPDAANLPLSRDCSGGALVRMGSTISNMAPRVWAKGWKISPVALLGSGVAAGAGVRAWPQFRNPDRAGSPPPHVSSRVASCEISRGGW